MRNAVLGFWVVALVAAVVLPGCGTVRVTTPARTATEQALVSTAADRAVRAAKLDGCAGKAVFVDMSLCEAIDKGYVERRLHKAVLDSGGSLAADAKGAAVVLQVASGALSTDDRSYLFGIPSIPLPIPTAGETLVLPELAIFKLERHRGKAKLLLNAVDPKTNQTVWSVPISYGRSHQAYLWVLTTGPYGWGDAWEEK
jgi:uncharacterized protein YceK